MQPATPADRVRKCTTLALCSLHAGGTRGNPTLLGTVVALPNGPDAQILCTSCSLKKGDFVRVTRCSLDLSTPQHAERVAWEGLNGVLKDVILDVTTGQMLVEVSLMTVFVQVYRQYSMPSNVREEVWCKWEACTVDSGANDLVSPRVHDWLLGKGVGEGLKAAVLLLDRGRVTCSGGRQQQPAGPGGWQWRRV